MESTLDAGTVEAFMADAWQREPRCFRGVFHGTDVVDGDELAGLACEDGIDARLVTGNDAADDWQARTGPFTDDDFAALPAGGWTLLVQSMDLLDARVRRLLDAFTFLPRWSLDDVMVSWSANGGGVGPHFDRYDVFLVQTRGRRRWRLGQWCDERSPLREDATLRLLADFRESAAFDLEPGDMLYVPAGLAHWGTALTDGSVTCSVGFRAPSVDEVVQLAAERLASEGDPDRRIRPAEPTGSDDRRIGPDVTTMLAAAWPQATDPRVQGAVLDAFGVLVTERRGLDEDLLDEALPEARANGDAGSEGAAPDDRRFRHAVDARFAWRAAPGGARLYANGEVHEASEHAARLISAGPFSLDELGDDPRVPGVVAALVEAGALVEPD